MKNKKLGLKKATIANLNNNAMRSVYGGNPDPSYEVTYNCTITCHCPDPSFIETYPASHC